MHFRWDLFYLLLIKRSIRFTIMRKNNKLYEENQIYVSFFHGHELNCEYSLVFTQQVGNSDQIVGQNLPNFDLLSTMFPIFCYLWLGNSTW